MKIIAQKIDLEYALGLTLKALSSKVDGRLGVITMTAKDDKLTLTTGDDVIVITAIAKVEVVDSGTVSVPGKLFYESIRKMSNCEIEIEQVGERVILNCNDGHVYLPKMIAGWEAYKQASQGAKLIIEKSVLKDTIKKTIPFCSTDAARPVLRGVNFVSNGTNGLTAVALDGYRVAKVDAVLIKSETVFNVIVPAPALGCIDSLIDAEGTVEVLISSNENLLEIKTEEVEVVATLLQGAFVDVGRIIPKEFTSTMCVDKNLLLQALDRAILFSGNYNLAAFDIKNENVVIKSQSDVGESVSTVSCKTEGPNLDVAFNAKYIMGALKLLSGEQATFSFVDKTSPAVIKEKDSLFLFMPIRRN